MNAQTPRAGGEITFSRVLTTICSDIAPSAPAVARGLAAPPA